VAAAKVTAAKVTHHRRLLPELAASAGAFASTTCNTVQALTSAPVATTIESQGKGDCGYRALSDF
jgi:hypothetical protein